MTPRQLMDYYSENTTDRGGCGGPVIMAFILLLFLLVGCKQIEYVPVEKVVKEYVVKTDTFLKYDSLYVHDSVFVHSKGDTIWYERWKVEYRDRWRERIVTDTVMKTDSIPIPYPVEKELTLWQKAKQTYGGYAMLAVLAGLVVLIFRIKGKFGL